MMETGVYIYTYKSVFKNTCYTSVIHMYCGDNKYTLNPHITVFNTH